MITEKELDNLLKNLEQDEDSLARNIRRLITARDRILKRRDDFIFSQGSIVFDTYHKEIGFVVGPLDVYNIGYEKVDINSVFGGSNKYNPNKQDIGTMLIITVPKEYKEQEQDNTETGNGMGLSEVKREPNKPQYRVRYVNYKYLKSLNIEPEKRPVDDLDTFCNKQCIMECSEDCALWKYKRKY